MSRTPTHEIVRLLEQSMVDAVCQRSMEDTREVQTLDLNINFMQSASGPLHASAQVIGGGKTMCFCEAQLRNAQAELVAQAMGTYRAQVR